MAGIGALVALPSFAAAQDNQAPGMQPGTMEEAPPPPPPPGAVCPPGTTPQMVGEEPLAPPPKPRAEFSPANQSFSLGGGVAEFVRDRISDRAGLGGAWDARYL